MRKLLFVLLTLFLFLGVGGGIIHAAEPENVVYTFIQEGEGTATFTLSPDGTGKCELVYDGLTASCPVTYTIADGVLSTKMDVAGEVLEQDFTINADNTLTEIYPDPAPEPEPLPDEQPHFEVPEELKKIVEWLSLFKKADLKVIFGVFLSIFGISALELLITIIKGIIALVAKILKKDKLDKESKENWERFQEAAIAQRDEFKDIVNALENHIEDKFNSLDTEQRKAAIEGATKLNDKLDGIVDSLKLE